MVTATHLLAARVAAFAALLLAAPAVAQTISDGATANDIQPPVADPVEALGRYLRVLAAFPQNLDALTGAGKAALAIGDANAAISFFARAEEIAPRDGRIKAGLAAALVQVEQPRTALKLFDQAVDLGVPEAEIAGDRGLAHDLRGESRRAQADYARALGQRPDDEITRRLAVSQAISGDRAGAMATLDALLRRQDRAAWRIRAFVLALTGDSGGAREAALAVMPRGQADALSPYFARLAALKPGQKAAAVHLGQFPSDGRGAAENPPIFAAADVAPPAPPAPTSPAPRSDVPLIPSGAALGQRTVLADAGAPFSLAPRRRPGGEAIAAAAGGPVPPADVIAPMPQPPVVLAAVSPPPARVAPPVPPPTPAQVAADAAAVGATSIGTTPPAIVAGPGFSEPLSPRSLANPASVDRSAPTLLSPPEVEATAAIVPEPTAPTRVAANSVTVKLDEPAEPTPAPSPAKPKEQPRPVVIEKRAVAAKEPVAKEKAGTKLTAVEPKPAVKGAKPEPAAAKSAKDKPDAKVAAKDKGKPDAKTAAKDKPDAKTADKAAPKDKASSGERHWVQVASGANKADLGRAWEKTKAQAPKLLGGRATWTAPWKASNRLLVGPFKDEDEAQGFVNSLGKAGMGGIQFTSRGGAKVERLTTK